MKKIFEKFAHGGLVPHNYDRPVALDRGWWKCKKCSAVYEAWGDPSFFHRCVEEDKKEEQKLMSERRYLITIEEICVEERSAGREWLKGGDGDPENFGYTPEILKKKTISRELLKQNVPTLDMATVIKAINGL